MSSKTLYIIFLAVVLAIGGLMIPKFFQNTKSSALSLPQINEKTVNEIIVNAEEKELKLQFQDQKWMIDEQTIDPKKINQVFEAFTNLTFEGPISSTKENHERFDLDEKKALSVDFRQSGNSLLALLIGQSAGLEQTYVRKLGRDEVFVSNKNLKNIFPLEKGVWMTDEKNETEKTEE